jgi:hypothetical protein
LLLRPLPAMPLDSRTHREVQRATRERRNETARERLARDRAKELAALRRENALLRAEVADLRRRLARCDAGGGRGHGRDDNAAA